MYFLVVSKMRQVCQNRLLRPLIVRTTNLKRKLRLNQDIAKEQRQKKGPQIKEAMISLEEPLWKEAIKSEIDSIIQNYN